LVVGTAEVPDELDIGVRGRSERGEFRARHLGKRDRRAGKKTEPETCW
jgi:hypothetical protein